MAHQYEATLGGAHTEHVHVLNVHSPIHTVILYCYIYEHLLQGKFTMDKFDISAGNNQQYNSLPS